LSRSARWALVSFTGMAISVLMVFTAICLSAKAKGPSPLAMGLFPKL
jgi:hypothetical protein